MDVLLRSDTLVWWNSVPGESPEILAILKTFFFFFRSTGHLLLCSESGSCSVMKAAAGWGMGRMCCCEILSSSLPHLSNLHILIQNFPRVPLLGGVDAAWIRRSVYCHPEACNLLKVLVVQSCPTLCNPMDCIFCPWNSPGEKTGVGTHPLLQGIAPTQGSNPGIMHCRQILYHLRPQGSLVREAVNKYTWCFQSVIRGKGWNKQEEDLASTGGDPQQSVGREDL